jgi:hypothetical protein
VRVLVYAQLKGILGNEPLEMHLRQNPGVARALGIEDGIPDRTTIGRWRERLGSVAREAFEKLLDIVAMLVPTELLVVDSTQLEDWGDPEAGGASTLGARSRGSRCTFPWTSSDCREKPS